MLLPPQHAANKWQLAHCCFLVAAPLSPSNDLRLALEEKDGAEVHSDI